MGTVLVGIDGSPRQSGVLSAAAELAQRLGARLLVVRAVTVSKELPPEAFVMSEDEVSRILDRRAQSDLDAAIATLPQGLEVERRTEHGDAWRVIVRVADEVGADVIVIGAHGYGMLERALGTTAARVVNHASKSVLVVR